MKIAAQILLVVFFVILFFVGLVSATLKFQLLDYSFWKTSFQKHNVYQNLADISKTSFESQINKGGGSGSDIKILTDLITTENVKDLVDRNFKNFLDFANGNTPQINVYVPIDKIPKNFLPKNFAGIKSEMTLSDLLTKFNFQDWQNLPIQNLFNVGKYIFYFFATSVFLILVVFASLILLVEKGSRFISLGIAFVLSGGLTFFFVVVITNLNTVLSRGLVDNSSNALIFLGTIFSPAITEIIYVWKVLGLILFVLGFALFFVKKPTYNNSK